jgi:cytochrome c oxidase subunit 3
MIAFEDIAPRYEATRGIRPGDLQTVTLRENQLRLGLWMFLATVAMLFAAFISAYIVRRSGSDWQRVTLPAILWVNTLILGASTVAVEAAHRLGMRRRWEAATVAFGAALTLGVAFLVGQVTAWRQMAAAGIYLPSSPHSSFFFMLTAVHAVHVVAALVVLTWGMAKTRVAARDPRAWTAQVELCRTFWHFLGGVWLVLFALVSLY